MSDERLTGLALMYIHPEIDIDPHTVVDRFASRPVNRSRRAENEKTKRPRSPADLRDLDPRFSHATSSIVITHNC